MALREIPLTATRDRVALYPYRFRCFRRRREALYGITLPLVITRWLTFNETSKDPSREIHVQVSEGKARESERAVPGVADLKISGERGFIMFRLSAVWKRVLVVNSVS